MKMYKKSQSEKKNLVYLPNRTENEKFPPYLPNYFSGQKGVQEKYLNMVVNKKSSQLAEKKPAYGRKKNSGQ